MITNDLRYEYSSFLKNNTILAKLIIVNVAIFLIINILRLFLFLFNIDFSHQLCGSGVFELTYWLAVPSSVTSLLTKPWTIITYMFLHEDIMHILFNMLMLYFSGKIFIDLIGKSRLFAVYFLGGISGAFLYILAFNIFPVFNLAVNCSVALGASASVLAILVAVSTFKPNYIVNLLFFGQVKLKYIAIVFILLDILSIDKGNPGGHIAHLGGALLGFAYINMLKKGYAISFYRFNDFFKLFKKKKKSKLRVEYKSTKPLTDEEYNTQKVEKQKKIDAILDKISKTGYENLTKEEKEFLFSSSNRK